MEIIQRLIADVTDLWADLTTSRVKLQGGVNPTGTFQDFTGIPSWVNRVTVQGNNLSTSGTARLLFRIGDGAPATSGYLGATTQIDGATPVTVNTTIGMFLTENNTAAMRLRFKVTIERRSATIWVITGTGAFSNIASSVMFASEITLAGALDRVRITTAGGADTFTNGALNISWE
jgi:hypothetical protein